MWFVLFIQPREVGNRTLPGSEHQLWMDNVLRYAERNRAYIFFLVKENNDICFSTKKSKIIFCKKKKNYRAQRRKMKMGHSEFYRSEKLTTRKQNSSSRGEWKYISTTDF